MQRIVLVGFAGSGKSTVGEYLVEQYGYIGLSFADALKDALAAIFCWDRVALEGNTPESRVWRETVDPWWSKKLGIPNFTPRYALRHVGTDLFRVHFDDRIWISNVERRILDLGDQRVVVTDGRFANEIDLVVDTLGGMSMRVKRGPEPDWWSTALVANGPVEQIENEWGAIVCPKVLAVEKLKELNIHPSEYAWIGHKIGVTLSNNGSVEDLKAKIDALLQ